MILIILIYFNYVNLFKYYQEIVINPKISNIMIQMIFFKINKNIIIVLINIVYDKILQNMLIKKNIIDLSIIK